MLDNKTYLYNVDYHSKFTVVKLMDGLSADSVINQYRPLKKIMSCTGTNFVSVKVSE